MTTLRKTGLVILALFSLGAAGKSSAAAASGLPDIVAIAPNFYYHDLDEAREWYVDKIGFKPVFDSDWLVMVEVGPGMEIALVDGEMGSLRPVEEKGTMLTVETDQLEEWFAHIAAIPGIEWFPYADQAEQVDPKGDAKEIRDHELIEEFRVLDPGGYIIEFYRWKPEHRPARAHDKD